MYPGDTSGDLGNVILGRLNAIFEGLCSYYNLETSTATPPDTSGTTYTVVKGDTLYGISRRFNTTVDKITNFLSLISN